MSWFQISCTPKQGHLGHVVLAMRGSSWVPPLLPCRRNSGPWGDSWSFNGLIWGLYGKFMGLFLGTKPIIGCSKPASKVCWTSFAQLFVDFNLTFGQPGPIKVNKQWIDVANRPYISHEDINLRVKLRWFRRFVQNMLREGQVQLAMSSVGRSPVLGFWAIWQPRFSAHFFAALLSLPVIQDPGMKVDVSL